MHAERCIPTIGTPHTKTDGVCVCVLMCSHVLRCLRSSEEKKEMKKKTLAFGAVIFVDHHHHQLFAISAHSIV